MPANWNTIAEAAYEAYAQVVRAEAQPLPVPAWEELPPRMQEGWREAAHSVVQGLCGHALETLKEHPQ
jgi:hypothetical protein